MTSAQLTALTPLVARLWERWQDEREYENILDYGAVIARELPPGVRLTHMTKRPFGFHYLDARGLPWQLAVKVRGNRLTLTARPK
jgi:hypothetical protein